MMPDCIVINAQNTREFYGCAEGLSVTFVNRQKMKL
jgi:toxic protein SymE